MQTVLLAAALYFVIGFLVILSISAIVKNYPQNVAGWTWLIALWPFVATAMSIILFRSLVVRLFY